MTKRQGLIARLDELCDRLGYPRMRMDRKATGIVAANVELLEKELREKKEG